MKELIKLIKKNKIICTLQVEELDELEQKIKKIQENKLELVEITYRTELTLEGIKLIKQKFPKLKVGCRNNYKFRTITKCFKFKCGFYCNTWFQ